jgi:DNA-binding cell septation regulator SpoVG
MSKVIITEVKVELIKPQNGLIAFASFVMDDNIYLSGIAVYKKLHAGGYRLLYPKKGGFNMFHPINKQTSDAIEEAIFAELKKVINKSCEVYDRYSCEDDSNG